MNRNEFLQRLAHRGTFASAPAPSGSLDPYSGPWTHREVIHLLRRTTFGYTKAHVTQLLNMGRQASVNALLTTDTLTTKPLNVYSTAQKPDTDVPFGQSFVDAPIIPSAGANFPPEYYQARINAFKAWWAGNIIHQKLNITEKLTLFWHNHFAIEADAINIAQPLYYYYKLLRDHCLGNFKTLTELITFDPAMLYYLNGYLNAKGSPDENYARELQELFTVGKGPDSKFTEDDVKAAAKILTGFRLDITKSPIQVIYNPFDHDTSTKRFSAFYGNKTIAGNLLNGRAEVKELIDMLFDNIETARHLVRKFYQFFVYYEISPQAEEQVIRPLADQFKQNGYSVKPVLERLFNSQHFYDIHSIGCVIKNPYDFSVGLIRTFNMKLPDHANIVTQYGAWGLIAGLAAYQGLDIGDPPLVSGWLPWYQSPQYHQIWINADTLANKNRVVENLNSSKGIEVNGVTLKINPIPFTQSLDNPSSAIDLVKEAVRYLYNYELSANAYQYLKSFLVGGFPDDGYWTELWNEYTAKPNDPALINAVTSRLSALYREIMLQAEYHLS